MYETPFRDGVKEVKVTKGVIVRGEEPVVALEKKSA
jgi:hypothetical protein